MKKHFFRHYFSTFCLFNLIFLILQFVYVLAQGGSFLKTIPLPLAVHLQIATAAFIQIMLYLLLSLLQTFWLWGFKNRYFEKIALDNWLLTIYLFSVTAILSVNCYFFPLSLFSRLFLPDIPTSIVQIIALFSLSVLCLFTLQAFLKSYIIYPLFTTISLLLSTILLLAAFLHQRNPELPPTRQTAQTNIIIIGVDSLSPERINKIDTPNLYKFINHSVHFKEAITPLARTYSAWSSILTGLYPIHHHARYNLMPPELVKSTASIVWTLEKRGYQTAFATDERRFSTIDKDFGFQTIIGPQLGVNDILLGTFYDFPLSNFLINLPISRWLFPYNYLNRASHFSYYPESFDHAVGKFINSSNPQKPLFLSVHFALPHWPYAWAASSPAEVGDLYSVKEREGLYFASIYKADQQVGILLNHLQQAGLLDNALVIVLSDHGESLYELGSRKTNLQNYQGKKQSQFVDYLKRKTSTELEMSAGHGSDLLSPTQFHCVLAFSIYKNNQPLNQAKDISTRVALIDIAPTILSFLHIPFPPNFDGISLLGAILNHKPLPEKRIFILESGELPNQIVSRERARVLGKLLYTVNSSNNQLQLRHDKLPILDALKLYAILDENWLIALYPDDAKYITVILNLKSGQWTDDLNSSFAVHSPVKILLEKLLQFYPQELSSYPKSKVTPDLLE